MNCNHHGYVYVPTLNTHGSGRNKPLRRCTAIFFREDVKYSCAALCPSLRKSLGLGISRREREDKNFCFGQHAAIIFSRARIFRAITARDGEARRRRERTFPSVVLNILRKTFSYKCPVGSSAFTGRIPSPPQRFRTLCVKDVDNVTRVGQALSDKKTWMWTLPD